MAKKKTPVSVKRARPEASGKPSVKKNRSPEQLLANAARLDLEIARLLSQRAELTVEWMQSLADPRQALFSQQIDVGAAALAAAGSVPQDSIRGIYRHLLGAARKVVHEVRVAYLGPAFSYSHQAAAERFGDAADLIPVSTIAAVFEDVNRGNSMFGVVPIENSTDGRIVDTLEMFTRLPLRICGEVQLNIHHNLMSRSPRSEITDIFSKPQAFSQCRNWLARHMPAVKLHEVTSTSAAAQLARERPGAAAIASSRAAVEYGLQVVSECIEDNGNNVTRFAVIGDVISESTGRDRTAVLLQVPHKPGALADALLAFKNHRVNLSWIESFPLRGPESGYLFFLDFEGHQKDLKVRKTLDELGAAAVRLEVLGSFPRSIDNV